MYNTTHDGLQEEQERVNGLVRLIGNRIDNLTTKTSGIRGEIVDIRRNFWDDVTVNFEDSAESAETHASMKQQAELLSERERSHKHMERELQTLLKLEQNPYFGRIDIVEDGEKDAKPDAIYLGIGSLLDDSGEQYLIYDWRAPVSSLYYDYGPGRVSYQTPAGEITGEMTLKRQYMIRNGKIKSMFDTGVTIGDELLQEVLGKGSDAAMKSIVATIQSEQNAIIRNEKAKLLVVQGAAGSGKTSAALQRVAYLLYRYRGHLSAEQIVLFSPNPMFNSYVSSVLPELGEQNMTQTTYQQYLEHRLGEQFELEDPFLGLEEMLNAPQDAELEIRRAGIVYKSGMPFMDQIDRYVQTLGASGIQFKDIRFRGKTIIGAKDIARQFYCLESSMTIPNRLQKLAIWLLKELSKISKDEQSKEWVDEAIELLDTHNYGSAYEELRGKGKFSDFSFDDYQSERQFLAAQVVQKKFKKLRRGVKLLKFVDMPEIYKALFRNGVDSPAQRFDSDESAPYPPDWPQICSNSLKKLNAGVMSYEDATPYLYLKEKLEGFHTNTTVKHLFIDEAQDYSPFQFHYLKRIFPRSSMTVLGDFNQSIFAHGTGDIHGDAASGLFPQEECERIVLKRSYRSTRQIVDFTRKMVPGGEEIIPFNRTGPEPVIEYSDSAHQPERLSAKLRSWHSEGYESLAIICKTALESEEVHKALLPLLPEIRLIQKETSTFIKGMVVIPVYLAKGVEFDAVVIANAGSSVYSRESERRLFYTACTRAMHELHLLSIGNLTPFSP
ncbi:RNA polymerase recycling motor HelD [Paenibacillus sp. CAU 1782]